NLRVLAIVALLILANVVFHIETIWYGAADYGIRLGLAAVMLLISLVGGRIIPSFTRNWLVRENPGRLPQPFGRLDMVTIAFSAVALAAWVIMHEHAVAGGLLIIAGALHIVRF